ncbi:MAG: hypothetical protein ACI8TA_003548, partial [Cyclobacteriaceae bacterium]
VLAKGKPWNILDRVDEDSNFISIRHNISKNTLNHQNCFKFQI